MGPKTLDKEMAFLVQSREMLGLFPVRPLLPGWTVKARLCGQTLCNKKLTLLRSEAFLKRKCKLIYSLQIIKYLHNLKGNFK